MSSIVAIVGKIGLGRTGGEQYNTRLFAAAKQVGFDVCYLTLEDSFLDKLMGLPVLWRLRPLTRTMQLTWLLWRSSGNVWIDVWFAPYIQYWAKHTSRQMIVMVHHLRGELERNKKVQAAESTLIRAASHILTVSQSSKQQIDQYLDRDVSVAIIPPGFERPQYQTIAHSNDHTIVQLLFVGHITRAKGVLDLIQAIHRLPEEKPWFLHIVGGSSAEPETWDKTQALLQEYGLSDKVKLYGRVEDAALQALYQQADVFVLPSYWEGYGIVFLEAMSLGLPVVSTTAGAIPEVVHHERNGLLVEAGDIQALSKALQRMIQQPEQRAIWAEEAKEAAKQAPDWVAVEQRFLAWWQAREDDVCGH